MIRPLIEAFTDYRIVFAQETSISARSSYKNNYIEACAFVAAEELLNALSRPSATLESVIQQWNTKNSETQDRRDSKQDYKSRLDELFKNTGKNYYRGREYERSLSRGEEQKEGRFSSESHFSYTRR